MSYRIIRIHTHNILIQASLIITAQDSGRRKWADSAQRLGRCVAYPKYQRMDILQFCGAKLGALRKSVSTLS